MTCKQFDNAIIQAKFLKKEIPILFLIFNNAIDKFFNNEILKKTLI